MRVLARWQGLRELVNSHLYEHNAYAGHECGHCTEAGSWSRTRQSGHLRGQGRRSIERWGERTADSAKCCAVEAYDMACGEM
jgi:hypothetical protein